MAPHDVLADCRWTCRAEPAGAVTDPAQLSDSTDSWHELDSLAPVGVLTRTRPALAAAADPDDWDWWVRTTVTGSSTAQSALLMAGGLATIAEVFLNGQLVLSSSNMFRSYAVPVTLRPGGNDLVLRFASVTAATKQRRPRPRWKATIATNQQLRWLRTSLLGRAPGLHDGPAVVGVWRPLRLLTADAPAVVTSRVRPILADGAGVVEVTATLWAADQAVDYELKCGGVRTPLAITATDAGAGMMTVTGTVRIESPEFWWPHTHGEQPRYPLTIRGDAFVAELPAVGFRRLEFDRDDGAFALSINGVPVFTRGVCWTPPDELRPDTMAAEAERALIRFRDAGFNLVRVVGTTVYESDAFYEACDRLGLMVWQDCMIATLDLPDEPEFVADLLAEVGEQCDRLSGHVAVSVISGGTESLQQPAMLGRSIEELPSRLLEQDIAAVVRDRLPAVGYVPSSPSGGVLPIRNDVGVAHYFGVGAYRRPLADAVTAGVRFAAECLAFSIPPEPDFVTRHFGMARLAGHHPEWKRGVPRDLTASWDFEDVRDFYVRELYGLDPVEVRWTEPERYLDLGRTAVAEAMSQTMVRWRLQSSRCAGAIVLTGMDSVPGAVWGLVDSDGGVKAPWYALRRVLGPVAVAITDDGLDGLTVRLFNDGPEPVGGRLCLQLFGRADQLLGRFELPVEVAARSDLSVPMDEIVGAFRDLNGSHRFGPRATDFVAVQLRADDDVVLAETAGPIGTELRSRGQLGLNAHMRKGPDGKLGVMVSTEAAAHWVHVSLAGCRFSDNWFHLPPKSSRFISVDSGAPLSRSARGQVSAVNGFDEVTFALAEAQ